METELAVCDTCHHAHLAGEVLCPSCGEAGPLPALQPSVRLDDMSSNTTCLSEKCDRAPVARGLCRTHYKAFLRAQARGLSTDEILQTIDRPIIDRLPADHTTLGPFYVTPNLKDAFVKATEGYLSQSEAIREILGEWLSKQKKK